MASVKAVPTGGAYMMDAKKGENFSSRLRLIMRREGKIVKDQEGNWQAMCQFGVFRRANIWQTSGFGRK
jgi:hypothetical protein